MRITPILLLFTLPFFAFSQENLAQDMAFFQNKAIKYQRWLDSIGVGKYLLVEEVRFQLLSNNQRKTTELELLLAIKATDPDSASALWQRISKDYLRASGRSLNDALFRTFAHNMEIPAAQGNVQVYSYDGSGNIQPFFFVWIWDKNGVLRDSLFKADRAQSFQVNIPPVIIEKVQRNGKTNKISKTATAKEVFDAVVAFAQKEFPYYKYQGSDCSGRFPVLKEESRTADQLVFSVSDLCREVLRAESLSTWCIIARRMGWERDCNDIRRERLTFTIQYIPLKEGYQLACRLDGKFGSGLYRPRTTNDYFDMDPDFFSYEKEYADRFKEALEKHLRQP